MKRRPKSVVGKLRKRKEDATINHFSHFVQTRRRSYTTFGIADEMLHQCLFLTILWLNHACGVYHYYSDGGSEEQENNEAYYEFRYGVNDDSTGDIKNQWEIRKGDKVRGEYSLLEPDGTVRIVQYSADKRHGFNAFVSREGKSKHPATKQSLKSYSLAHPENAYPDKNVDSFPEYLQEQSERMRGRKSNFYSSELGSYEVAESKRKAFYTLPDVPANHSPYYTGISDYNKLMTMYKNFREQNLDIKKHKFDYGINEYFENGYEALGHKDKNQNIQWREYKQTSFT